MVIVVGGGASGLMGATTAARAGARVLLIEKNDKVGRKLYITGKGRCNVTNQSVEQDFAANIVHGARFLCSALSRFDCYDTMAFFEAAGVPLKVERGERVFPASDHASDIIDALLREAKKAGVKLATGVSVTAIEQAESGFVVHTTAGSHLAEKVMIATGGASYRATGSSGDGQHYAQSLGHTIVPIAPALVGIRSEGTQDHAGLSLRNVSVRIEREGKVLRSMFGEMLFTHTGFSGPVVLSLSSFINREAPGMELVIDTKPALDAETLDRRLLSDFAAQSNKQLANVVADYLPHSLVSTWIDASGVDAHKPCHSITKAERARLIQTIKGLRYPIKGFEPLDTAIVTAGGVSLTEINPRTMESKLIPGLFFGGEVMDIDALTGGFNLQLAFSTGYCAGLALANAN